MAIQEIIENQINTLVPQMIDEAIQSHTHNGGDSQQLTAGSFAQTPQPALTAPSPGSLSSGGLTALSNADSVILTNALVRLAQLESRLQTLGYLS